MSRDDEKSLPFDSRIAFETAPRCKKSPCFRTTPEGRIPLVPNWDKLLSGASKLPAVSLQTRHNFARLVTNSPLAFLLAPQSDEPRNASLSCLKANWHHAWARVAFCPCCQSPGRVEICNRYGLDVIQICAPTDFSIDDWALYIGQNHLAAATRPATSEAQHNDHHATFPTVPSNAVLVANTGQSLPNLLEIILRDEIPVEATLDSEASRHSQLMILRSVALLNGLLTLHAKGSHAQIALSTVRSLAVSEQAGCLNLHAVGAERTCLFTFCAHPTRIDDWAAALRTVFSKFR